MSARLAGRRRQSFRKSRGGCREGGSSPYPRKLKIEWLEDRRLLAINPFPLPLQVEPPLGSLVYESSVSADLAVSGETDDFTIDLDDGQTITVVVDPDTTLQPTIQLSDPGSTVIGTATAAATGRQVVLQTIPTTGAGTYTVTIGGAGTTGAYTTQAILNAGVELEEHDGPGNDEIATAQELTQSYVPLGGGSGQRAAVLGSLSTTILTVYSANMDTDPGWTLEGGWGFGVPTGGGSEGGDPTAGFTGSNVIGYNLDGDYSDDMPIRYATTPAIDASAYSGSTLSFYRWLGVESSSYDHASVQVSNDGSTWTTLWEHTGDSLSDTSWTLKTFDVSAVADGQRTLFIRWGMGPTDYSVTYPGWNIDDVLVTVEETTGDDYYRMEMAAGQSATVSVTSLGGGSVDLELFDASGTPVARGVAARNVCASIANFVAPAEGTYYAKVSGKGDYSLLAASNADLDNHSNNDPGVAQELSGTGVVLGYLAGTPPTASTAGGSAGDDVGTGDAGAAGDGGTAPSGNGKFAPAELIVRFADLADKADKVDLLAARGATMLGELPLINGAVVRLHDAKADVLEAARRWSADPVFVYAEPNYRLHTWDTFPSDPSFASLWGLHNTGQTGGIADADVDAPEAWSISTGSSGVVVASIDTGVDYNHEDLAANMWVNPGETPGDGIDNDGNGYIDDIYGIDTVNGDSDPLDDYGHGTHTAGTIGAVGDNGIGVVGLNWDVQIMALKFLDADGFGSTDAAITSLDYMTMMKTAYGINVVASNNSWGGGGFSQALEDAIRASNEAGIMFVAAAGNGGWDGVGDDNDLIPHYPSSYELEGIIAVAATDHSDRKASFSNYGATSVDLGSPGVSIFSTMPGNGYSLMSGTSMAAPHVAGAVAMAMAYDPNATLAEVKAAILDSVDTLPTLVGNTVSGGRLNVNNALALMGDPGDYYALEVNSADVLLIRTSTPSDGPLQFENLLDPAIELYDPSGRMVGSDGDGAPDGRNAQLTYTAEVGGTYTVRVLSAAEKGEYVLEVSGNTGERPPFEVRPPTDPADGGWLGIASPSFTVDFNDTVLLSSLEATDLTIDDMLTASSFTVIDGDTVVFDLPALAEGPHEVAIAAGTILDVQGTAIEEFAGTFTLDLIGPRVADSSIQEGDRLPVGSLTYRAHFDKELDAATLDPADVELVGLLSGMHVPAVFDYGYDSDTLSWALTLEYPDLPEDIYRLTLLSGDGALESLLGNDLDGEPVSFPIPPNVSGDGVPGGDFFVNFSSDATRTDANAFERLQPFGGLMFASRQNMGTINSTDDQDDFAFFAEAGETISGVVYPDDPAATLSIELVGQSGPLTSPAPGMPAVLPPVDVGAGGDYVIRISGDTYGTYRFDIGKNLASEIFDTFDGSELNIDASFVGFGSGRYGLLGTSDLQQLDVDSLVWGVQPATGQILLIDPATGNILHRYDAPDALSPTDTQIGLSIAEAGRSLLYINSDVDPGRLYRLDPFTGEVLSVETTDGLICDGLGFESGTTSETVYSADMNTDPGWTLEGGWEFGVPTGGGSEGGDPTSGFTGSNVIGYNLNGDYSDNMPIRYATTPAIDASAYSGSTLSFYRWLGVEDAWYDHASVELSNDGSTWTTLWEHTGDSLSDTSWTLQTFDISAVADGQSTVFVRWGMGPSDDLITYPGWNIDDVRITGTKTLPPRVFLCHDGVEVRRQEGFSGTESSHFTFMQPAGAVGGDDAGRQFARVSSGKIVEYLPETPNGLLRLLNRPATDVEGLAFDGASLYAATASGLLFTIDPDTGAKTGQVSIAGGGLFGLGAIAHAATPYSADMDTDPGWTLEGGWEFGVPTGGGSAGGDPTSGFTGSNVIGYNLNGDYSNNMPIRYATTPAIDASAYSGSTLSFYRWLGVEDAWYDHASVEVSNDGSTWTTLWEHTGDSLSDTSWTLQTFDISAVADGQSTVFVRWGMGPSDDLITYPGWNIDDVQIAEASAGWPSVLLLPDVDEYEVDLTGKAGQPIDVVLAGQQDVDFSGGLLELLDVDGLTPLATAVSDPLSVPAENYDLAILDFVVPADGLYTLRVTSTVAGDYGIVLVDRLVFDSESNNEITEPLRSLDGVNGALGFTGIIGGPGAIGDRSDLYEITLAAGETLLIYTATPFDAPAAAPLNDLDPALGLFDPSGALVASDENTQYGKNSRLVYNAPAGGSYTIEVLAEEGAGNYLLYTEVFDGPLPLVGIDDVEVVEGDEGTTQAVFTLTLSGTLTDSVTVQLDTLDDTATVTDGDYDPISGQTWTFHPGGPLTCQVPVQISSDARIEPPEAFFARLSNASGAIIADPHGVGTILNDDTEISIDGDLSLLEGDSDVTSFAFTVSLVAACDLPVTVRVDTADGTATVDDQDYDPVGLLLSFEPGDPLTHTVVIDVLADTQIEPEERLYVNLSDGSQPIAAGKSQAVATILNDDTEIIVDDVTLPEGNGGTTVFDFTVSLAAPVAEWVTVIVDTGDGTATVKDNDYLPIRGLQLTFAPEEMEKTVTVHVVSDPKVEGTESFRVKLNHASQPIAKAQGVGTIVKDEPAIIGRRLLYNGSAFDWDLTADLNGNGRFDPGEDGPRDDHAIATDKRPLLPGETASFDNYTSYSRGINGIMVDIAGLADAENLSASDDFEFKFGNDNDPDSWPTAATPTIDVRPGEGEYGSDRVTLIWDDNAVPTRSWLQVRVKATENTGLAQDEVFYFGNSIGDADGDRVAACADMYAIYQQLGQPATVDDPLDVNRDGTITEADIDAVFAEIGRLPVLEMIRVPHPADDFLMDAANQYSVSDNQADLGVPIVPLYTDRHAGGTYGQIQVGSYSPPPDSPGSVTWDENCADAGRGVSSLEITWDRNGQNGWFEFNIGTGVANRPRDIAEFGDAEAVRFMAKGDTPQTGLDDQQVRVKILRTDPTDGWAELTSEVITLDTAWADFAMDLSAFDLTPSELHSVQLVLGDELNSGGGTIWLDEVRITADGYDPLRVVQSYQPRCPTEEPPFTPDMPEWRDENVYPKLSSLYDNALAIKTLLATGDPQAQNTAVEVADAIIATASPDGSYYQFRNGGHVLDGDGTPRSPLNQSRSLGDNAWLGLALLDVYRTAGDAAYLGQARAISDWAETHLRYTGTWGGYQGGWGSDGLPLLWRATEHNIDLFALNRQLATELGNLGDPDASTYAARATHAGDFVMAMFDPVEGKFWTGTGDGTGIGLDEINQSAVPLDAQMWSVLTLGLSPEYAAAIDWSRPIQWAEANLRVTAGPFSGFTFDTGARPDRVWFEGTAHAAAVYYALGEVAKYEHTVQTLERARQTHPNGNGHGLVAASDDGLQTGFGGWYDARLHVGATAWSLIAQMGINPFEIAGHE